VLLSAARVHNAALYEEMLRLTVEHLIWWRIYGVVPSSKDFTALEPFIQYVQIGTEFSIRDMSENV
jgi:hypothetical protein